MKNFRKVSYNVARVVILAVMWLSVAPVLAGSSVQSHHGAPQLQSSGESVVYKTNGFSVAYKNQFPADTLGPDTNGDIIDYF